MSLFTKNQTNTVQSGERQMLEAKYRNSRSNLLFVIAFTVINIILLVTQSNSYFLFSAYIPYMFVDYGMYFGGMYPTEAYGEYLSQITFLGKGFFAVMLAIAVVILLFYLVCWIFSKKPSKGWLITALVFFSMDTVGLILMQGINVELILDYVFHGWVIVSLVNGILTVKKLKNLPEEPEIPETVEPVEAPEAPAELPQEEA